MSDMVTKVLLRAAELVERGHCKHAPARDETGQSVWPTSSQAVSWCISGAILRAHADVTGSGAVFDDTALLLVNPAMQAAWKETGRQRRTLSGACAVVTYNNRPGTKPKSIVRLLRRAAELS